MSRRSIFGWRKLAACLAMYCILCLFSALPGAASDSVSQTLIMTDVMDFLDRMGETELKAKVMRWWMNGKIRFGPLDYGANAEYDRETDIITIKEDVADWLRGDKAKDFWVIIDLAQTLGHEFVHTEQGRMYWNSSEISNRGGLFGHFGESEAYYAALDMVERWVGKARQGFDAKSGGDICGRVESAQELRDLSKLWIDYNNSIKALDIQNRQTPLAHYTRVSGMLDIARDDLTILRSRLADYTRKVRDGELSLADEMDATEDAIKAQEAKIKGLEKELDQRTQDLDENPWFQLRENKELEKSMTATQAKAKGVLDQAKAEGCMDPPPPPVLTFNPAVLLDAKSTILLHGTLSGGQVSMSASGSFKAGEYCDPAVVTGPQEVIGPVRLRAHIIGNPPVPQKWSLGNWNSGLTVLYERKLGIGYGGQEKLIGLAGQVDDNDLTGDFDVPGPGRLTMVVGAARGSGPLTGSCFEQSFTATLETIELLNENPAVMGDTLDIGDGVKTGPGGHAVLDLPGSSTVFIDQNTWGTLESDGSMTIFELKGGSLHIRSQEPGKTLGVRTPTHYLEPLGTEYACSLQDDILKVRVFSGKVRITGQGEEFTLESGQETTLPGGEVASFDPSTEPGPVVQGQALRDMPWDAHKPEPYAEYACGLEGDGPGNGWFLQDPGADSVLAQEPGQGFTLTVPTDNDFWQDKNTSPRLLHKASGDFDLEAELFLDSPGNHLAMAEFLLYSPGSAMGILAGQSRAESLNAHYRLMGGWLRYENLSKLPLLGREHRDSADAPDDYVHLRLTRRGKEFKLYWSLDGQRWILGLRQQLALPETIWAGMNFKRMALDGQGPVTVRFRSLSLTTAPRESLTRAEWDLVAVHGQAEARDTGWDLRLPAGAAERIRLVGGDPLPGDFDMVARFSLNQEPPLGNGVYWGLAAVRKEGMDHVYIQRCFHSGYGDRCAADCNNGGSWLGYVWHDRSDSKGWLRITRLGGRVVVSYWADGRWVELRVWDKPLESALYPVLYAGNDWSTNEPQALDVTLTLERLVRGAEAAGEWSPPDARLFEPMDAPQGVVLPPGVKGAWLDGPYTTAKLLFGPDKALYALSSSREIAILGRISDMGAGSALHLESEALKGINGKGFVFYGQDILLTVDYWPDGGTPLGGLYQVSPDGSYRQWELTQGHGGLIDIIPARDSGWYLSDFENDGVFLLKAEATPEQEVSRDPQLPGAGRLALDQATGDLYVLNWTGSWPFGGESGLYVLDDKGQARPVLKNPAGKNYGGLAWCGGSGLPRGIYLSDTEAGQVLLIRPGAEPEPFMTGLDRPGDLAVSQDGREMAVGFGEDKVLWIRVE